MSVHCSLTHSNIILARDFGIHSFDYQYWEIFCNNWPIFTSNSFNQANVCVNLGLFVVPCRSLDSMSSLFYVCGRGYLSYSRYHSYFHFFVHRTLQYMTLQEKRFWKETKSTVTAFRNDAEISWPFYENWTWQKLTFC